jgi:hypothetical protein
MASRTSRSSKQLSQELAQLARTPEALEAPDARALVEEIAAHGDAKLVAELAKLAQEHGLRGIEPQLKAAYAVLSGERASADTGCLAKEALLAALDALECLDADLFARAARYVQPERGRTGTRDTGARVRARGVLGIGRLGHHDLWPILGAALADQDGTVRLSAAQAVGHRGQRDGAGLLLLRLGAGDSEPEVAIECLRGLFAVAPDLGRAQAQRGLDAARDEQREQTLHALGTVQHDQAVELLADELARRPLAEERRRIIEVLGLSLRPSARALLVELVRSGSGSDADAALTALAIHRYDARLVAQLQAATEHSAELQRRCRELGIGS